MPTFSHSSLSTFESCPLHYKLRYIDHVKPPDDRESIELFAGKRVHEALAYLYEQAKKSTAPGLNELKSVFEDNWKSRVHSGVFSAKAGDAYAIKGYFDSGSKWITDYYLKHAPFNSEETLKVEWRLTIPLGEHDQYKLVGVIDRLSKSPDGSLSIHDYKTSRTLPTQGQLEFDRQLSLYEIGVRSEVEDSLPVRLVWHYLAFNEQLTLQRARSKLEEIERNTIKLAIAVQGATEESDFPAKKGPLCEYCEYKPICPAWNDEKTKHTGKTVQTKLGN